MTLYELIANEGHYHKAGSRYAGQCPKCGGSSETTRFITAIGSETGKCFSCGWRCNLISYLKEIKGMKCKEAWTYIGRECDRSDCPAWNKCKGIRPVKSSSHGTAAVPQTATNTFTPSTATTPADFWQVKAAALVDYAHGELLKNADKLNYLADRGLNMAAVIKYRLGYLSADNYRERKAWGLPEELKENNQPKKLWIPAGIVIPFYSGVTVHRIRIRKNEVRDDKDLRYYWLPGSGNDLVTLSPGRRASCTIESDLDSLLIDHLAGDLVSTIPLGTCAARPKCSIKEQLENSAIILIALDNDKAGAENWLWWQQNYPQSVRLEVPKGKDPGEAWQQGVDLRAWILSALPISLHPKTAPAPPAAVTEPEPVPAVYSSKTADGREFIITDDPEEYDRLSRSGHVVFSGHELETIRNAGYTKEQAGRIFDLKAGLNQIFTGAVIEQLLPIGADNENI